MRPTTHRSHRRPPLGALATALLAITAGGARADEPSPYYIGASQSITHDSNVDRTPVARGDTYYTTSLLGGFDQTISRQHLHGSATVGYSKYNSQDSLNNTSYSVAAGWDWATIEQLSGSFNASAGQSLATLYGNSTATTQTCGTATTATCPRNLVKTDQVSASVNWGGAGRLGVFANAGHSRVRYSDASTQSLGGDSSGDTGSLGVNYNVGPEITTGVAARVTRTHQANAPVFGPTGIIYQSQTTTGRNLDLTGSWRSTAQTNMNARLSWTRQTSDNGGNDFSGLTGSIGASYAPTAKLAFNASYSRDAGTNGQYFNSINLQAGTKTTYLSQNSTTSDSLGLGATYAATAKVSVSANAQYRRSSYDGNIGSDNYKLASLGANWAATRYASLGCNVSHESRSLQAASYSANIVGCTATITLR
ncbi:MAG TPA: outer membrane beta-barrel protein [Burkholderiaceae bacterium]|nr:outer membrane beta-barrel protein [Burkholderiaceae bacterium]